MQWTVVAIATRGGADGEGVSPSPVSRYDPHTSPPTPPGLRPPPPPRGAGAVMAISKGKPCLNIVSDGSSFPVGVPAQFLVPEDVPLDLSGDGLWEFRDKLDRPRILVRGGGVPDMGLEFFDQRF
jgi:hypothetical protein